MSISAGSYVKQTDPKIISRTNLPRCYDSGWSISTTTTTASTTTSTMTTTTTTSTTTRLCSAGFSWDGSSCIDIDECSDGSHACASVFATCSNSDGSYDCNCKYGFTNYKNPDGNGEIYCMDNARPIDRRGGYQTFPNERRVTTDGNITFIISTYFRFI